MRFLIFHLLFILSLNKSFACLSADQNRMFPIGISPKGFVVVEIHMEEETRQMEKLKDYILSGVD